MTAGNSTPLTDGASTVLLASDEWAAEHKLPVLAHFVDAETAAVDYVHGDRKADGLLMAPVYALPRLLARNKLTLQDFDFYEIHEAFAVHRADHAGRLGGRRVLPAVPRPGRRRSARSTAPSSTSTARRWRPVTRSPPPAAASSPRWPSCCTRTAAAAG